MNARNAKAKGLERSWNHAKELNVKTGEACARADSEKEIQRKPNPRGRPK